MLCQEHMLSPSPGEPCGQITVPWAPSQLDRYHLPLCCAKGIKCVCVSEVVYCVLWVVWCVCARVGLCVLRSRKRVEQFSYHVWRVQGLGQVCQGVPG